MVEASALGNGGRKIAKPRRTRGTEWKTERIGPAFF
jgi:hypothetical protein